MSLAGALKGLVFKKQPAADADPRRSDEAMIGGRRRGEVDNPYLAARRTWNEHQGALIASRQAWQVIGILALLIALAGVGGIIHVASQSKFVPYVIEVDKLGQTVAVGPAQRTGGADLRVVHASVAQFIGDARLVSPDVALQRQAVFRVYAKLSPNDAATHKMNEWMNATEESTPFKRAATETVSVEITSVLPQTPETWQIDWIETTRDRSGSVKGPPARMRALVTVYIVETTPETTEEQIRNNPGGVFVRDFSWSKQI